MSDIDLALLIGAIIASVISYRVNPRGILWIALAAYSFVVSTIYWRSGLPYPEGVAGACDALVCLGVYFYGREMWEMAIWRLFQTSVAVNFLYLAGHLGIFVSIDHTVYSSMLEAINWLILLLIGGMGLLQRLGVSHDGGARRPWRRVYLALHSLRREAPFHKA